MITRGSGNVFADLGFPDAAERQAKLRLAYALNRVVDDRKLSQADAAKMLGLTQPKVSALRHYKLVGFSLERLMNLLTAIDHDIEIMIRPNPRRRGLSADFRPPAFPGMAASRDQREAPSQLDRARSCRAVGSSALR